MKHSRDSKAYRALVTYLTQKRHEKDLTTAQLAERLNQHPSVIGKIETSMRKLDVLEFVEYCDALGIETEECLAIVKAITRKGKDL